VPYIGAFISAAFPLALAAAVDPGWSMLLLTAALFIVMEPVAGHVVEPLVYGHSTGLSPVAVVVAATFWTWLWGPIGLVLATPLTVCLVVLGRHVERLEFLDVMLGDRPALSPPEIFYQRMLAGDPAEAAEPKSGRTQDPEAIAAVAASENEDIPADLSVLTPEDLNPRFRGETPILCIGGQGSVDEAAALMLAQLLTKHGLSARVESTAALSVQSLSRPGNADAAVVCLSYLDAGSPAHMRYAVRRLRRKLPQAKIVLGCWTADTSTSAAESLREAARADFAASTLREATALCLDLARTTPILSEVAMTSISAA
jgi:hypothetical protein